MIMLTHVQKVVEQSTLLEIESLEVLSGAAAAVVGLTGQAKNMFLELLSGRSQPTAGTIQIAGLNPAQNQSALALIIGILPPENNLYSRLTVRRNLLFYCDLYGLAPDRADEVLHQVGLMDRAHIRAKDLPPEMARRLAFGRAILHDPPLLILVDPFVDCRATTIDLFTRLSQGLQEKGTTLFVLATEPTDLSPLCQVIHVLEQGKVLESYNPQEEKSDNNLPFKIPARLDGKVALINPGDILYAFTEESKTVLCTGNGRVPTHLTLNEVEQRLARSGFFRAHRSYLVNLQHVTEVIAYTRNSYTLILEDRSEIPLSKSAARDLRELLDY
jgi:ABC-2 type transport system ATP-binding protein